MNRLTAIVAVCLCMCFMLGIYCVDQGVSMLNDPGYFQSLMLVRAEPRVVYHLGLVIVVMSFFLSVVTMLWCSK